ncbi:MAG: hypothetical protein GY811_21035 [Myxococcales bacterium]|nr:hypothetical protein [Myxococcales bacterium]
MVEKIAQPLRFVLLNLFTIMLYLNIFSIATGESGGLGFNRFQLLFALFCVPFIAYQWHLLRRVETWPRRLLALYKGMLAAMVVLSLILAVGSCVFDGASGVQSIVMFGFGVFFGHVIGLPGLVVVGGVNVLAHRLGMRLPKAG